MRHSILAVAAAALTSVGCATDTELELPPQDRFYFPTGLFHRDVPGSANGLLYVASSNFDRRYDMGALHALSLDQVSTAEGLTLPAVGAPLPGDAPLGLTNIGVNPATNVVTLRSFAGQIDGYPDPTNPQNIRLFIPSRGEGELLHVVDAQGTNLACFGTENRDCAEGAPTLNFATDKMESQPRGPEPFAVAVAPEGQVFVTHLEPADQPLGSAGALQSYVVRLDAQNPAIGRESFIPVGPKGSSAIAVSGRYVLISGYSRVVGDTALVRLLDRQDPSRVIDVNLENAVTAQEARGLALDSNGSRLFVVGRAPDTLIVADVSGLQTGAPLVRVVRVLPLPAEPQALSVIPRAGRGSLVAVASAGADSMVIYDDEVGQLVAQVAEVGRQPFDLTVDVQPTGARIFVSNFGDGQVAVIDIADLARPEGARLVGRIGLPQTCPNAEEETC